MKIYRCLTLAILTLCGLAAQPALQAQAAPPKKHAQDFWKYIHLQQAFDGTGSTDPATFSFLNTTGGNNVGSADFALIYKPSLPSGHDTFSVSGEGKIASDKGAAEDAVRLRLTYNMYRPLGEDPTNLDPRFHGLQDTYTTFSLKHEANKGYTTQKLLMETVFTLTDSDLAMGGRHPVADKNNHLHLSSPIIWRPYFGVDAGDTLRTGDSTETSRTVLRLLFRLHVQLDFGNPDGIYLYVDNKAYALPLEHSGTGKNFLVAGLVIPIKKDISFELKYKVGKDSPDFQGIETFGGGIGIKF